MHYECKNTIAAESEKIVSLYTASAEEGAVKGAP
jgi:hypothetical protein